MLVCNNDWIWTLFSTRKNSYRVDIQYKLCSLMLPYLFQVLQNRIADCLMDVHLTLSYSSTINGYLYHQRVSPPLKKTPWYVIRGQCCPSIRVWQRLWIVMAVWRTFYLNSNFLGRVWQHTADYNGVPKGHYYLQRAVTPEQITQQNSLQRAGAS